MACLPLTDSEKTWAPNKLNKANSLFFESLLKTILMMPEEGLGYIVNGICFIATSLIPVSGLSTSST